MPSPRTQFAIFVAALAGFAALAYFTIWRHRGGPTQYATDDFCDQRLAEPGSPEARAWMRAGKIGNERTVGEQTPATSKRIVEDLYARGATAVYAIHVRRQAGFGETTNALVALAPRDESQRRALFAYGAQSARAEGHDSTTDVGQKCVFLWPFKGTYP